ncbi:MAG: right-handed parallel beta-helix repeat-containing protein [Deltaproteobacteria bacterium]|nr:right-handed parallel beta-helix repeat-containing protein [Deltaproteobacteria bacterium]
MRLVRKAVLPSGTLMVVILILVGAVQAAVPARAQTGSQPEPRSRIFLPVIAAEPCPGRCYYVDSAGGSDSNPGTSGDQAWQTLAPVHAHRFLPGDIVRLKRGSRWYGGLVIDDSGEEGNPITFTSYGEGESPVILNPGDMDSWTRVVVIKADWIVLDGLKVMDSHDAGIFISPGSDHNIIRNIEATDVGFGVVIKGQKNLITNSYIHDLHIVRSTPAENDDFGAVGIVIADSYNEVANNRIINCIAPSLDYGVDGGAVEWWSYADNNYVHHNWTINNNGFLEVGGGSARDNLVSYNVSINNRRFSTLHLDGKFSSIVTNFRIENNTIVEMNTDKEWGWVVFNFGGDPDSKTFIVRNNVISVQKLKAVSNKNTFTHDHNLYQLGYGTKVGFVLGPGEMIDDPLFVNPLSLDFHLQPLSPAINAGISLGYTVDFENRPVPVDGAPDLSAFEYQSVP